METSRLIAFLTSVYPISPRLHNSILELVYPGHYKKGQVMASPGKRADEIWFLENGLAKEYYYEASGKTVITTFWRENELMVIAESFFRNINSDTYIELIEDCNVLTIGSNSAHKLHDEFPEIYSLGYSILSEAKRKSDERSSLLRMPAKEGYRQFCINFPWQRISVADSASYLGMSREALSAVRSKK